MISSTFNNVFTIKSFAKINWVLEILSKRQDGYHNISSVFDLLPLFDVIKLRLIEADKWDINIRCNFKELEKENILYKLVDILSFMSPRKYRIEVKLEKNIPLGGGLGGGSSNAASIIFFYTKTT